jgi:hypothetical protein
MNRNDNFDEGPKQTVSGLFLIFYKPPDKAKEQKMAKSKGTKLSSRFPAGRVSLGSESMASADDSPLVSGYDALGGSGGGSGGMRDDGCFDDYLGPCYGDGDRDRPDFGP